MTLVTCYSDLIQPLSILDGDGLPGWEIAVIAVAVGGGGAFLLSVAVYRLVLKRTGTYSMAFYLDK